MSEVLKEEDFQKLTSARAKILGGSQVKTKVALKPEHAAQLRDLNDRMHATNAWVQTISQQGERRIAELTKEGREIWVKLAAEYELDVSKVNYDLDETGTGLVAKSMRF